MTAFIKLAVRRFVKRGILRSLSVQLVWGGSWESIQFEIQRNLVVPHAVNTLLRRVTQRERMKEIRWLATETKPRPFPANLSPEKNIKSVQKSDNNMGESTKTVSHALRVKAHLAVKQNWGGLAWHRVEDSLLLCIILGYSKHYILHF